VRELENAIERALRLVRRNGIIRPQDLPPQVVRHAGNPVGDQSTGGLPVGQSLDEYSWREQERRYIDETIKFKRPTPASARRRCSASPWPRSTGSWK